MSEVAIRMRVGENDRLENERVLVKEQDEQGQQPFRPHTIRLRTSFDQSTA